MREELYVTTCKHNPTLNIKALRNGQILGQPCVLSLCIRVNLQTAVSQTNPDLAQ